MIKDFSISFSRVIIVQDIETVTCYVLFVHKPTFSVIFCWMERLRVSSQFNSLFILYISIGWVKLANIVGPTWRHSWSYNVVRGGQTVQLAVFNNVW